MTSQDSSTQKALKMVPKTINDESQDQIIGVIFTQMQQGAFFLPLESQKLEPLSEFQPLCQINPLVKPNLGLTFNYPYLLTLSKESNVNIYEVKLHRNQQHLRMTLVPKLQIQNAVLQQEGVTLRENLTQIRQFEQYKGLFWLEFTHPTENSLKILKIDVNKEGFKWQSFPKYIKNLVQIVPRYSEVDKHMIQSEEQCQLIYEDLTIVFDKKWSFDQKFDLKLS